MSRNFNSFGISRASGELAVCVTENEMSQSTVRVQVGMIWYKGSQNLAGPAVILSPVSRLVGRSVGHLGLNTITQT